MADGGFIQRMVRLWWIWAIAAVAAWAVVAAAGKGFPILELEFAWTADKAAEVLAGADLDAVRASIYTDFLFLALYAPALFFGALWVRERSRSNAAKTIGLVAAFGGLIAGILDANENLAMLAYVNGSEGWILLAGVLAATKFLLVAIALVYILTGLVVAVSRKMAAR